MTPHRIFFLVAAVIVSVSGAISQTASAPAPTTYPSPKQIDIGAAEAPLSDSERTELDQAVRKHDYAAEKAVIDRAAGEHPGSFELLVMTGRLAYLEKHPGDSAAALERADRIKPLSETDRVTLALAYAFSQNPAASRIQLQKLMNIAPKNAEYPYLLGRVESDSQHPEEAAKAFAKAIQLNPNMVRAYEELGRTQESLGLLEQATKTYQIGVARNRESRQRWEWSPIDLGVIYLKAGDNDTAEKLFREALQYNPRSAWAHYYMGQLFQKKGKNEEAVSEYEESVVDQPLLRQAWLALGREFTREGNTVEADKALTIFKKLEAQENARQGKKN